MRKTFWKKKFEVLEALGVEEYPEAAIKQLTEAEQFRLQQTVWVPPMQTGWAAGRRGYEAPNVSYDPVIANELRAIVEALKLLVEGHEQERKNIDKLGEAASDLKNTTEILQVQTAVGSLNANVLE